MISVIVPVYNCADYIRESIGSILHQTYNDFEVIIVDDGSTDCCPAICDEFAERDNRIRVVHIVNGGVSVARNTGLSMARGDYICFVDGDDMISPDFLEKMLNELLSDPSVEIAICGVNALKNGHLSVYRQEWLRSMKKTYSFSEFIDGILSGNVSCTVWNKMYRARFCKNMKFRVGRISEEVLFNYYASKSIASDSLYVVEIPDMLYMYRMNDSSVTHKNYLKLLIDQVLNYREIMYDTVGTAFYPSAEHIYVSSLSSLMTYLAKCKSDNNTLRHFQKEFKTINLSYIFSISDLKNTIVSAMLMYVPRLYGILNKLVWKRQII